MILPYLPPDKPTGRPRKHSLRHIIIDIFGMILKATVRARWRSSSEIGLLLKCCQSVGFSRRLARIHQF